MPYADPDVRAAYRKAYRERRGPEWRREIRMRRWRKLKREIIDAHGGKCACCGEDEIAFLAIDHVNGGGSKHRATMGHGGNRLYQELRKSGPRLDLYRVLCHNCNFATWANGGVCPHKRDSQSR